MTIEPPIDALLDRLAQRLEQRRRLPEATYRVQLHGGFTFRDAARLVPYLAELGITHLYCSPYLKARPGSTHGYDIIDHSQLNPEIGTQDDYDALVDALHAHGMGQILDTVPNHMGITGNANAWWNDVLENGPSSPYANYFDISWQSSPRPELRGKVLLPVLGESYGKVLESGQLRLSFEDGGFAVYYYDHRFPINPRSYAIILGARLDELERRLPADAPALQEYQSVLTAVRHLPPRHETDPAKVAERQREKEVIKRRLSALTEESAEVRLFLDETVALFNGTPGASHSFDLLDRLLEEQAYRLSFWRVASDEINYRRFFDINDLAALSMERPEVFAATHALIFRLLREGKVDGLRIDHPDGLFDPRQYLVRLQQQYVLEMARDLVSADAALAELSWDELEGLLSDRFATAAHARAGLFWRPLYVVIEKILAAGEPLPNDWPIDGTSGYSFLNECNRLFIDAANAQAFTDLYYDILHDEVRFREVAYDGKRLILRVALSSELQMLAHQLDRIAQKHRWSRDYTLNTLRHALREIIASFPVYRSYISAEGVRDDDRRYVELATRRAMVRNPALSRDIFRFVRDTVLLKTPETTEASDDRAEQVQFAGKFQQVTAPVTAKGIEDTAFYVYNRLVSLNEVGGDPDRFGSSPETMHRYLQERQAKWPRALSALSTHDTKRSADVRARLNVLSELPTEWARTVRRWAKLNAALHVLVEEERVLDANEEYLLYQTLVGAWPLGTFDTKEYAEFVRRIQEYMEKALHEAKVHTSWINPNPEYDAAVQEFIGRLLDANDNRDFLDDINAFLRRVASWGLYNALAQALLEFTAPGVPDTYQGAELWDFSLVDPDNRRPVDFERRRVLLAELRERVAGDRLALARELVQTMDDGRIKLYVTWQALTCRRHAPGLFSEGEYLPLEATADRREHVFAFARRHEGRTAVAAVPRLITRLGAAPLGSAAWLDARLLLPGIEPGRQLRNVFTGTTLTPAAAEDGSSLRLAEVFADFPVALLLAEA